MFAVIYSKTQASVNHSVKVKYMFIIRLKKKSKTIVGSLVRKFLVLRISICFGVITILLRYNDNYYDIFINFGFIQYCS